ncbi:hypothetical protein [Bacteroides nordii]|uniref:hypothetical protein n=1 Tax=Bacteroides nordii TaxID=291645 RepID=UPI0026DBFB5A|nr:hypothetical protein [Bacteroides nordii]
MHKILINDDLYHLPESWDELTVPQLLHLVKLTKSDIPIEQLKIEMLLYCLQAHVCRHKIIYQDKVRIAIGQRSKQAKFTVRNHSYLLTPEEVNSLANLFQFLLKSVTERITDEKIYYVNPLLSTNPYPTFRYHLHTYTSPDDGLLNITFEQYMYLQTYLDAMRQDPQNINLLLACLWHRGKVFDINRIEKDAAILKHLPDNKKMLMYWFILGSLSFLSEMFPDVFSGDGKGSGRIFDSQLRLLDSLAQSDMTKKNEVRHGLLIDALYSMDESISHKKEIEERFNK